jgi:undecaprenyl-diphosphatase
MTHFAAIILGIVEGLTEFIPVSSSGHLLIAHKLLGQTLSGTLTFDAIIQLATACALLVYFWREIWQLLQTAWLMFVDQFRQKDTRQHRQEKERVLVWAIVFGTIPAVVFGLLLQKSMDTVFRNVQLVALTLLFGSWLMWYAQKYSQRKNFKEGIVGKKVLSIKKGIVIGFYQCLALLPGVSRSGATISGGLFEGLSQEEAVRFSFLLSVPVLFGAGLLKLFEVRHLLSSSAFLSPLILGSVVAFLTGLASISFLMKYLKTHNLNIFIWYRVVVAILILILL